MQKRRTSLFFGIAASLLSLPIAAQAQTPRTIYLYNAALGKAPTGVAAKNGSWGNGVVSNARDMDFEGAPVLKLTTRNFQEGARFDMTTPIDLTGYQSDGFIRLRLRFRDATAAIGGGAGGFGAPPGGGFGGPPGGGFGGPPPGNANFLLKPRWDGNAQFGGNFGGALPPLGGGAPQPQPADAFNNNPQPALPSQATNITELAITLLRDTGVTVGRIPVNLDTTQPDEDGWRLFVLPLKEMTSTPNAAGPVKRILITSDKEDSFYMAQAALVVETGQITVTIRRPQDPPGAQIAEIEVKPGALNLIADVEAGAADPQVEWNFDADNVGNLPPGAISNPAPPAGADAGAGGGADAPPPRPGMRPGLPGGAVAAPPPAPAGGLAPVGARIDALGLSASFSYPNEEQNYRVEVTVRDRSGQKQPVTASMLIRVRA